MLPFAPMSEDKKRTDSEPELARPEQARVAERRSGRASVTGGATGQDDNPTKLHSPLFPLLWLLFPFLAMLTYGLITRN